MRISDWSSDVCSSDLGNLTCGAQFNIAILDLRKNQANSSQPFLVAPLHGGGLGSFDLVANHRALSSSCLETHSYSGIKLILIGLTLDHEKPNSASVSPAACGHAQEKKKDVILASPKSLNLPHGATGELALADLPTLIVPGFSEVGEA